MLWWTLHLLKSSKPEIRVQAANKLGTGGNKRAVSALIDRLEDEDRRVRLAVIEALAALADPGSADALSSALGHLAGRKSGPREDHTAEYEGLAKALSRVGEPAVAPLIALLSSQEKDTRRWASSALGFIKSTRAVDPLIRKLEDGRSEVRRSAAASLGEIGDPTAVAPLIKSLSSRDMETRHAAAEALGKIQSTKAEEALILAVSDPSEAVQIAAINSLGRIGGLKSAARLRAAAGEKRKVVSQAAEIALKGISFSPASPEEEAELIVIRGDFEAAVRKGASAVPALIKALEFTDPEMRIKAAESLGTLKANDAIHPLITALHDSDKEVQNASARALSRLGDAALDPLHDSLAHYDATVVQLSAEALGAIGDVRSASTLLKFLESTTVTNEYPEMMSAVQAAVNSLQAILKASCKELPDQDLERIVSLPQLYQLPGYQGAVIVDCAALHDAAGQELIRRKE